MPRRLAKPAWRCARSRVAFRFLVWRRARLASPRSGFYLCSCQLVLSLGIRLRNSSQPDHPMLSLRARGDLLAEGETCFAALWFLSLLLSVSFVIGDQVAEFLPA